MTKKKPILTPAELVIVRFGGVRPLSRLLGMSPSTVCTWKTRNMGKIPNTSENGDARGTHLRLLDLAKERKIQLTANELIYGGRA